MTTPTFTIDDFSPQMQRILQLAAVEASAGRNQRGDRINCEHFLVAMHQEGECDGFVVLKNAGFSVADIRAGKHMQPRQIASPLP